MTTEICTDCGRDSDEACPFDATTCSECSLWRERLAAGVTDTIPDCPAHGQYLEDPERPSWGERGPQTEEEYVS